MNRSAARRSPARRELLPLLVLLAACCLFFWKAVALRGVFFHYDHALQNFPYRAFFADGLRQGRVPLWTPDLFCGFPLLAESQGNPLYPPFLLLFGLLRPWAAYNYYTVLHFFLAGAFTYLLARVLRVGRAGATVAGLCYMLCGPVLTHAHHTNIVVGVCYLPLLLALIELACRRRTALPLLAFAVATAMLLLGAQPQYTLYCALACGAYLLWRLRLIELTGGRARTVGALIVAFGLAGGLAALLAAAQVLPLLELVGRGMRAGEAMALPAISPGVPGNLLTLLLPHYWGSPGLASYWGDCEPGLYAELTLFMGVAPLMLALVAVVTDRSRKVVFFTGLAVFSFLFAMGFSSSLYNAFALLPIFRTARYPSRFAFVTALCVAMLAGMGLDALLRGAHRRRVARAALLSAGLTLVACVLCLAAVSAFNKDFASLSREQLARAFPLRPGRIEHLWNHFHRTLPADVWRLAVVALVGTGLLLAGARRLGSAALVAGLWCALIFGELAWAGRDSNAVTPPAIYNDPPPLARLLRELPRGRILRYYIYDDNVSRPGAALFPFTQGWAAFPERYARSLDRLPYNANMLWGIPSVNGFSPLQTRALRDLLGMPKVAATLTEVRLAPALDLLNVRWILALTPELPGDFVHTAQVGDVHVFENPHALPRAFIVHKALPVADDPMAVALLRHKEGFDYRESILLHDADGPPLWLEPGAQGADESADVVQDDGDRIRLRAELARPGYLVLADQHYPGWTATVDGRPAPLLRADRALKAVRLPAGRHEVRLAFRPRSFRIGLWATLAGLILLAAGAALRLRARRGILLAGAPEAEDLLAAPCGPRAKRLAALSALLLLALGPVLYPFVWSALPLQMDPRWYVQVDARGRSGRLAHHRNFVRAYETIRDASLWWPENHMLHHMVARTADRAVRSLMGAGRVDEARRIAREALSVAPREVQQSAPALARLAGASTGAPQE